MSFQLGPKSAIATLAVVALPLPLHLVGRAQRARPAEPASAPKRTTPQSTVAGTATTPASTLAATSPHPTPRLIPAAAGATAEKVTSHALRRAHPHRGRVVHAANDPADTIQGYKFNPTPLTIHVGDTVTWTNEDSVQHSATSTNGAFNTGLLSKGQSGSHTFTQPGTYSYICEIHPFMHGTIIVLASSTGSSGSGSGSGSSSGSGSGTNASAASTGTSSGSSGTSSSAASTSNSGQLPMTGLDIGGTVLSGLALLAGGLVLRRRIRALP